MADGSARFDPVAIGPATESRIVAAFADACIITAAAAAGLLGFDPKTLREMSDAGIIRAVRVGAGKTRGYTEGDIRAYLTESAALCPSTSQRKAPTTNTTSRSVVADFTARRALKRGGQPRK